MTAGPGDLGDTRTLQDPLAEALRVVDLADAKGLLVRLMGGMAIRAHAPDWPARTRRVEVDLDFATRGKDRGAFYELLASEGYTADKRHNALFGGKQAYFVDVAAQPAGRRPRRQPRDVPPLRVRGPARRSRRPTLPLAELLLSKLQIVKINRKDVLDALVLLAEHPLGPGRRRARRADRAGRDQRAAHPVVHLERLGLVADRHRQPRHARPVPRGRAARRTTSTSTTGGRSCSSRAPRSRPCERRSRTPRSRRAGSCARGSASARSGTRIPRRWGTTDAHLLRHRHPRLRGVLAQVPQRRRRSTRPTSWSWAAT